MGTLCTAVKRRHSITEIRTWLIEFFVQFTDSLYSCLIKTSLILVNNSDWNQRELSRAPCSFASAVFSLRSELPLMKRLFNRIRELYAWVTRLNDIELSSLSSCCMFVAFFHYRLSNTTRSNMEYHNMAGVLFTSICRRSTEQWRIFIKARNEEINLVVCQSQMLQKDVIKMDCVNLIVNKATLFIKRSISF